MCSFSTPIQYTTATMKTIAIQMIFAMPPAFSRSRVEKYPEEYVIAFPGVAITSMNARPPQSAMIIDASRGLMPGISVDIARPIGSSIATAPMFDMIFVNRTVKMMSMRMARYGLFPTRLNIWWANHDPAPVCCMPTPRVIAPPYSSIIPHGTLCSMSFQLMHPVMNKRMAPSIAITTSPRY